MSHLPTEVDPLLGRAQIATLAGVGRPTVTAWEKQAGFPSPRRSNGQDYFRHSEIMSWLDRRPVPSVRLLAGEPIGTTYGDRARRSEGGELPTRSAGAERRDAGSYRVPSGTVDEPRPESRRIVTELMGGLVDRVRGAAGVLDYLNLLLCLHYLRGADPGRFDALAARARTITGLDAAAQLLRDIGRSADDGLRARGVHSSMTEALRRLEPRTARDLRRVVDAMSGLDEDVFGLILDAYEQQAALGSGEFFTPRAVVRLMTRLACSEFGPGRPQSVYDPFARDGGFLIEAAAACSVDEEGRPLGKAVRIHGETRLVDTWRLATMNLLLHGVSPALALRRTEPWNDGRGGTPKASYDIVLTNPPFNMSDPGREQRLGGQWAYGAPPLDNDNFAYVQHCLAMLGDGGRAGIIMPNKAGNSGHPAERIIRRNLVEAGIVDCVIALPAHLFTGTAVPVSVWLLRHPADPCETTLFLDARHMGAKDGPRRVLGPQDAESLLDAYRAHREGEGAAPGSRTTAEERRVPGAVVSREGLRRSGYSLNPLDHVERRRNEGDGPASGRTSAWGRLSRAEERLAAAEEAAARLPFVGDRRPLPPEVGQAPEVLLDVLCEIQAGPSYSRLGRAQRSRDGSVPVVFPQHLRDRRISDEVNELVTEETARRLKNFELRDEDIVCVRSGAIVPPALVREREAGWLMSPNVIRLRVLEAQRGRVLPEYLFHYLCLDETVEWMRDRAAATAAPSLRSESLGALKIPLPDLAEQQQIARALSGVDELDRAHREVAASLRDTRIALAEGLLRPAGASASGLTAHRPSEKGARA
ncbi:N-6 DNA methylase [Streptomyces cyaneofuscatus]|uniref:N-6 DNA methylase n=1 Tax=Streptomyces cyaneofuscatus TaxID=66883 RepID=UPI0038631F61|nr:N-6 DNA methylase [Streptomyces cyaneofuscatus]